MSCTLTQEKRSLCPLPPVSRYRLLCKFLSIYIQFKRVWSLFWCQHKINHRSFDIALCNYDIHPHVYQYETRRILNFDIPCAVKTNFKVHQSYKNRYRVSQNKRPFVFDRPDREKWVQRCLPPLRKGMILDHTKDLLLLLPFQWQIRLS